MNSSVINARELLYIFVLTHDSHRKVKVQNSLTHVFLNFEVSRYKKAA